MKRAFVYTDEKSDKFWWINYDCNDFVVNYGKNGTTGKYEIKELDSEEECKKQAIKLINEKIKKGYKEIFDFDFINRYYFDDEEIGLHRKTSNPILLNILRLISILIVVMKRPLLGVMREMMP